MLLNWGMAGGGIGRPSFALGFANLGAGLVDTSAQGSPVSPTFTRTTIAQALLSGGTFGQAASGSARGWFSPAGVFLGYIAEGARTNLCVRSQAFNADWVTIGTPTISSGTTVLGTVQLDTIGDDSAAALEGYSLAVTFTGDAVKGIGIFMKAGTSTSSVVRLRDGTAGADRLLVAVTWTGGVPTVTMTTGTDQTGTISAAQLGTSGAYWLKFATTSVTAANSHQIEVYPATDAALSVGATGTVQAGVVNEEDATFASSPIITTGAAITRNADVLTYPTSPWFNAVAGTILVNAAFTANAGTTQALVSIDDTTTNERLQAYINGATSVAQFLVVDGGVTQADFGSGAITANALFKFASAYATNDFADSRDGQTVQTDTSGTLPTCTTLNIGRRANGGVEAFVPISSTKYFPPRLANGQMQNFTR